LSVLIKKEGKDLKSYKVLFILILTVFAACQNVHNPDKIPLLGMLSTKQEGDKVEFRVWVKDVLGDEKLGLELLTTETTENYPTAIITLKDGQKNPGKEKTLCIRGVILKRGELSGATLYRIKDAEVIECY
jgi:hypothetical protein